MSSRYKEYYDNNRDKVLEKARQAYIDNSEKILDWKNSRRTACICGSTYRTDMKIRHERTIKHNEYLHDVIQHHLAQ